MKPGFLRVLKGFKVFEVLRKLWVLEHELKTAPKILLLLIGSHCIKIKVIRCLRMLSHIVEEFFGLFVNFLAARKQDRKFMLVKIASRSLVHELSCDYFVFNAACFH